MSSLRAVKKELSTYKDPSKDKIYQAFFKTKKGEYGYGDIFLGITVPNSRLVAKKHKELSLADTIKLLHSKYHEERLVALIILIHQFNNPKLNLQKTIFDIYIKSFKYINNWDLVDVSAPNIVGTYLLERQHAILYKLAKSKDLWSKRVAIIATFAFIRKNQFKTTLDLAQILLHDEHYLIHKAVGWMLREVGKKNESILLNFLNEHYKAMPRTMLRYAIEKFEEPLRKKYLLGLI